MKKKKEKKLIWNKIRCYVDFLILVCCFIVAINIHPSKISNNFISNDKSDNSTEKTKMIYIFHDYEGNEFIMNDNIHWASSSWDDDLKWDEEKNEWSVSIWELFEDSGTDSDESLLNEELNEDNSDSEWIKNNQVSIEDIMSDLWIDNSDIGDEVMNETIDENEIVDKSEIVDESEIVDNDLSGSSLDIDVWNYDSDDNIYDDIVYIVVEKTWNNSNYLVIEKFDNDWNVELTWKNNESIDYNDNLVSNENITNEKNIVNDWDDNLLIAKYFTFVDEWWVLPALVPRNDLFFWDSDQAVAYIDGTTSNDKYNDWYSGDNANNESKKTGITIIEDYADCMTPWWYKIRHWESVLAYKQMDNAPNICNIERRFCWKWKLSGTYTQQWCSVNENYTYEQRWDTDTPVIKRWSDSNNSNSNQWSTKNSTTKGESRWKTKQNEDWSVSVKTDEIWWSFVFNEPNSTYTDFTGNDNNIRPEDSEVEQTDRPLRNCTAPRWERVKHWQFVQAFKHKNWFSDIPCEAQFRLCTMWDLMWTFTESWCKTWDTSFIDWVYGSPTRQTYSEEKLELIKK